MAPRVLRGRFIEESHRTLDEATGPGAVGVPHGDIRGWLKTWGTPEEEAADLAVRAIGGDSPAWCG
ncbi:MAG: hypothetical protein FJ033_06130 [Chloroflexi bacterium]|nr:hypothetical protein [Chloroflexota bacterium]